MPRMEGHRAGSKSVREIVETCGRIGIRYLSLYAFSKENWKRPKKEIATLWRLLEDYLSTKIKANFVLLEDVKLGDWVILHAGFAISQMNEEEAQETLQLLREYASHLKD